MRINIASSKKFKEIYKDSDEKYLKVYFEEMKKHVVIENGKIIYPSKADLIDEFSKYRKQIYEIEKKIKYLEEKTEMNFLDFLLDKLYRLIDVEYSEIVEKLDGDNLLNYKRGRELLKKIREDKEFRNYVKLALEDGVKLGSSIREITNILEKLKKMLIKSLKERKNKLEMKCKAIEEIMKYI